MREIALIVCGLLTIYLLLSLLSYDAADPSWSYSGPAGEIANSGGIVGAWCANFLLHFFGVVAYAFPLIIGYSGWALYRYEAPDDSSTVADYALLIRLCGVCLAIIAGCGMATLYLELARPLLKGIGAGGMVGELIAAQLRVMLGDVGATLVFLGMFLIGSILVTGKPWGALIAGAQRVLLMLGCTVRRYAVSVFSIAPRLLRNGWLTRNAAAPTETRREPIVDFPTPVAHGAHSAAAPVRSAGAHPLPLSPTAPVADDSAASAAAPATAAAQNAVPPAAALAASPGETHLPALSLLDTPRARQHGAPPAALDAVAKNVRSKLAEFGIEVEVVAIHPGPVVTRYELQPAPGLKVSRITSLAKDLARSLSTISVRIEEVIPGKTTIGLEIPNKQRELVMLSELLASAVYSNSRSPLTLVLGKGIAGQPLVADLAAMPHLLVAGTTGSGKSVAINAMILSLLYKASPEAVRMLMIDPKMLELSAYDGIAHLLAPVVTNMNQAANALRWCVAEMERRYQLMSTLGVRNIAGYNAKVSMATQSGAPLYMPPELHSGNAAEEVLEKLPFIVVVIDEFADMMMTTGKKVEELIVRLAQKARAAGIHLLLATQRPSVNVITGLIKANIPSRVAFQVSSRVDSRTILDQGGAESLLGHGDMLFLGPGTSAVKRVHGAFVADHEVHKVVDNLKQDSAPAYLAGVLDGTATLESSSEREPSALSDEEYDELYDQALYIVTETRKASISLVQRRLKIGYNRAARLLEKMEIEQVVGPLATNGSRAVLAPPPPRASEHD